MENQTTQSQQPPTVEQLMAELSRINARLNEQQTTGVTTLPNLQKRPRPILLDPEAFDGSNRTLYLLFKTKLQAKLSVDREALGGPPERLWYAFDRLNGSAAAQILPWISIHAVGAEVRIGDDTVSSFFEHLDSVFVRGYALLMP